MVREKYGRRERNGLQAIRRRERKKAIGKERGKKGQRERKKVLNKKEKCRSGKKV